MSFRGSTLAGVLVTALLLGIDTVMKATLKRKFLIGALFTVSEGESLTIMVGTRQQIDRHGARAVAESLNLTSG